MNKTEKTSSKVKPGLYLDRSLIEKVDGMLELADAKSRNEFVTKALNYYIGYLCSREADDFLLKHMYSMTNGMIANTERKITLVMKRMAIEQSFINHLISDELDMPAEEYEQLLLLCEEEVNQLCKCEEN